MSLLALGGLLEGVHAYSIIDGNLEADPLAALEAAIRAHDAGILAVTVMGGPQLEHALPQSRALKRLFPSLTIVWGGYFPTQHYEVCLKADYVDYVVRGHGERVFLDLVTALQNGTDPAALNGLAYHDTGSGSIKVNPAAPIPNPDMMPDYPYHRLDIQRYVRPTFMGRRTLPHHSSYGCPFLCNFCAVVNMVNGQWLTQSAERTAAVVQRMVREWDVDAVEFYDNNFFVHEARTAEFAERITPLDIGWWGEARVDTMLKYQDTTWQKMRDSGLRMVFLGAESGSDETLKRMNKGGKATAEKTLHLAEKMKHYGIVPEFSFVLGNPPDPVADSEQTMDFIRRVKQINPASEIILYMYTPVPLAGTLFDEAQASGFAFPETLEAWVSPDWREFSQRRSAQVPWVKDPLRKRIQGFEQVLNAYFPTSTDVTMSGTKRRTLRALGAWRYHTKFYAMPLELRIFHKLFGYRRPETSSF